MVSTRASSRADSESLVGTDTSPPRKRKSAAAAAAAAPRPSPGPTSSFPASSSSASSSSAVAVVVSTPRRHHAPTFFTLVWLIISLPLVIWDTAYVLGRPHTMPGGAAHWPLWTPYKLYGEIDYVYGWKAVLENNGFTAAQASLNLVETALYLCYLGLWYARPRHEMAVLKGKKAGWAVLIGFGAAVMTLSKTVLYWSHEYFCNFANIGHNNPLDLLILWIIPNGAWLVGSTYMTYSLGSEILNAFQGADAKTD